MNRLALLLTLLFIPAAALAQQPVPDGTRIDSTEISGLSASRLSPGLREAINDLTGTTFDQGRADELAARIEAERPDVVAAVRTSPRPDGTVRVIFLVARIGDDPSLSANINSRYEVESVSIEGVPEDEVPQGLRDDLQKMVGERLDVDRAETLRRELEKTHHGWDVERRTSRGTAPGRVAIVYEVEKVEAPISDLAVSRSKLLYHGDLEWSAAFDLSAGSRDLRGTLGLVFTDKDTLIENYSGYRLRLETRKLGTEHLGAGVEVSWLRAKWTTATLDVLSATPSAAPAYDRRRVVEPVLTATVVRGLQFRGGATAVELRPLDHELPYQRSNTIFAEASVDRQWTARRSVSQHVTASYRLANATNGLNSDFTYRRQTGQATYTFEQGASTVIARVSFGRLTRGPAPLFERFSLGDTTTLRGWSKFDVAPAGGDRMVHYSAEGGYHALRLFVDAGSVWDAAMRRRTLVSTGVGVAHEHAFLTVGFPLNADRVSGTAMLGVRF